MFSRRLGHRSDYLVSGRMAKGVVVNLEFINIKHADGEWNPQTGGLLPFQGAVVVVPPPVGHPGKLVRHRLKLRLLSVLIQLDMGVYPGPDNQGMEGFYDIVHRPQGEPPLFMLDGGQAGDQDNGNPPGNHLILKLFQQVEAVHIRHDYIQQNERKISGAGLGQSIRRCVDSGDIIAVLQNGLQLGSLYKAVINNQYLFHIFSPCLGDI